MMMMMMMPVAPDTLPRTFQKKIEKLTRNTFRSLQPRGPFNWGHFGRAGAYRTNWLFLPSRYPGVHGYRGVKEFPGNVSCNFQVPGSGTYDDHWLLKKKYGAFQQITTILSIFHQKNICFWRGSCCQPKSRFHPCLADRLDLCQLGGSTSWDLGHTELGQLRFHVLTRDNKWLGHDGTCRCIYMDLSNI